MCYNEIEPKGIIMKFNITIARNRRFFQRKPPIEKYIKEMEAFQKEWNALYEHGERIKEMKAELEANKK